MKSGECIKTHYTDIIMGAIASQITSLTIVYSIVYSDADQRKHQSSASLAFVLGIHRGPVNSPHNWPVTRKMFPFDDVIMYNLTQTKLSLNYPTSAVSALRWQWRHNELDCVPNPRRRGCLLNRLFKSFTVKLNRDQYLGIIVELFN